MKNNNRQDVDEKPNDGKSMVVILTHRNRHYRDIAAKYNNDRIDYDHKMIPISTTKMMVMNDRECFDNNDVDQVDDHDTNHDANHNHDNNHDADHDLNY